jgi:hypothetical protein
MAHVNTSYSTELLATKALQQSILDEAETAVSELDNIQDGTERVQQQLGQLTGINLERNERVE